MSSYLASYDRMADRAAAQVIASYSTSFGLSTKLLAEPIRSDIRNLYAMVRIADEIVDGAAEQAECSPGELLDAYEKAVRTAPATRFHTDPVLHAYGRTARRCNFRDEHIAAFFSSMRRDLNDEPHTKESVEAYIYGSAEVIGLLCLAVFYAERTVPSAKYAELERGARALGSAFQKINFLRDFAEDTDNLGRRYFPGREFTEGAKNDIVADIRQDLLIAQRVIADLPLSARTGVLAATYLFSELTDMLAATPAGELRRRRVSVPARRKAVLIARAVARAPRMKGRS